MALDPVAPHIAPQEPTGFRVYTDRILVHTDGPLRFIDLTEAVQQRVHRSGIVRGQVTVQTRHTTTAVIVNENEPLLLEDLTELLREWAPRDRGYRHDDMKRRTPAVPPDERPNGHAHARAILLGASVNLVLDDSRMELGRWQSIFLVELDGAQRRTVSVSVAGVCHPDRDTVTTSNCSDGSRRWGKLAGA